MATGEADRGVAGLIFDPADSTDRPLWPNQRPRDAATLILIDRSGRVPSVLMGRRHTGHKFMPGKFVFPGGRLEPCDRRMPTASELRSETIARLQARVMRRSVGRERALALTAIRETYEETGLMLGRKVDPARMPGRSVPGWGPFLERGVLPDLDAMVFVGRAITPPRRPKRFDTRFFAIDRRSICEEVPGFVGPDRELVELVWIDLRSARELDLPQITATMLGQLEDRLADGFPPDSPVPFYRQEHGRFRRDLL